MHIALIILLILCVLSCFLSWKDGTITMKGFPLLFLCVAVKNFLGAWSSFRRDSNRKNQVMQGIVLLIGGILFLGISGISAIAIW